MKLDTNGLEVLARQECLELMRGMPIGRVVFTDKALPAIQPVGFALDGEGVIVRTAPGSKLAAATCGTVVAFQVDDFDETNGTGWSATLIGHARAVHDPAEITRLSKLPLRPSAAGPHDHFIRIRGRQLSGRRINPANGQAA